MRHVWNVKNCHFNMKGLIDAYVGLQKNRDRINKETDDAIAELEQKRADLLKGVTIGMASIKEQYDEQYGNVSGFKVIILYTGLPLCRDNGTTAYFETEDAARAAIGDRFSERDVWITPAGYITRRLWPTAESNCLDGMVKSYESLKRGAEGIVWPEVKKRGGGRKKVKK